MNTPDDTFLLEHKEELISEQCLDNLFTKMNFDGLMTDLAGIHEERCTSPKIYDTLSSPATPLLTLWNYLDTIKEESVLLRDDVGKCHVRASHRRVVSYDDVHRLFGTKQSEDLDVEKDETTIPFKAHPFDRPLHPRQARHSLPSIYSDSDPTVPEKGFDFGYIEFPTFALPPRSFTEPPETSSPLHFIIENPAAGISGSPLKRRHSITPSPVFKCSVDSCEKTFSRLYNLHAHVKSHDVDRPFICNNPDCNSSFARCHDLKRHEKTHLKDKPYNCAHCKRAFTRNDALTRHLRLGSCPLMIVLR